jgi:two-component system, LytTR family, response regulator
LQPKESAESSPVGVAIVPKTPIGPEGARGRDSFSVADEPRSLEMLLACLEDLKRERVFAERFLVRKGETSFFVCTSDIDWIESSRNHVVLHVGSHQHAYHATTAEIESRLNPRKFLRIHRSAIVNIERIQEIRNGISGSSRVTLRSGILLSMSRPYRKRLFRIMAL